MDRSHPIATPADPIARAEGRRWMPCSVLMLGAGVRAAGALVLVLGLWLGVAWALLGP